MAERITLLRDRIIHPLAPPDHDRPHWAFGVGGSRAGVRVERGTLIAGKYELIERLGRGGMGEVWAGRDRDLHRDVAVKILAGGDDDDAPELHHRFEREAVAAAQINHPNVVSLYDRGVHDGLQFLVMERIDGGTLARHIREHGPMPPPEALRIAGEICAALVAAHRARVVHYDIKPSNVMVTDDGRVKVVDFGIAGFTHAHTFTVVPTSMLAPAGTAHYGAPEQFLDQRGDERSDLYALGGILFTLLTGRPPFGDGNPLSIIRRKLDDEPPPLDGLPPDVPEPVAVLLTDLLQRDPDRRPQTASQVYDRLRTGAASPDPGRGPGGRDPDVARPPSSEPEPTRRLRRETPRLAGEAFEIAWTGREPVTTYVTRPRRPLLRPFLLLAILALPGLYPGVGVLIMVITEGEPLEDLAFPIALFFIYTALLYIVFGHRLAVAVVNWRRHKRGLDPRPPWSLRVDAAGITTTDPRHATPAAGSSGRRTFGWHLVAEVTLTHAAEFSWGPALPALHIRPAGREPRARSVTTAGTGRHRRPWAKAGLVPLCVLGPMTESQHEALIAALAHHAGPRWRPDLSE